MSNIIRIGTRESQLAVWQADTVKQQLAAHGIATELVYIKSEGDTDLKTPLYEIGVQGIFTRALDIALLTKEIDIAVHSMKDVPTQLARGVVQAAVLPRASYTDIIVPRAGIAFLDNQDAAMLIATSSVRRRAQWLNRYPNAQIENLRGNVNTRLRKLQESNWDGAIFAAAGLERIGLRPENAIDLGWMLPAPAQGAIVIVCREGEDVIKEQCGLLNDRGAELCTKIERDFLRALQGGCTTPISALATIHGKEVAFNGNILSTDGRDKVEVSRNALVNDCKDLGTDAASELLAKGVDRIVNEIRKNAR